MHLGVILMALQMLSRPPTTPITPDQQELLEIIRRAAKAMEALLDRPVSAEKRKH
jgi:signal transduction histidine kinase